MGSVTKGTFQKSLPRDAVALDELLVLDNVPDGPAMLSPSLIFDAVEPNIKKQIIIMCHWCSKINEGVHYRK